MNNSIFIACTAPADVVHLGKNENPVRCKRLTMTLQEFQKRIIKTNWYDKYYYYFIACGIIAVSIFLLHNITVAPAKYLHTHTYFLCYILFSLLLLFGCYSFYLVPKSFIILTVDSSLKIPLKKKIIEELRAKLSVVQNDHVDSFYYFNYKRKWWAPDYDVYLNADNEKFYISVLVRTNGKGGFINLGGAYRLKKKITSLVKELSIQQPVLVN